MENKLKKSEREKIWMAFSDAFVHNEVDYNNIASRICGFNLDQLEENIFREVAPYCGVNLMSVIPVVWDFFLKEDVFWNINKMLEKSKHSFIFRIRNDAFIAICRWKFRDDWNLIKAALSEQDELR